MARCPQCRKRLPLPDSNTDLAVHQVENERLQKLPYEKPVKLRREMLGLDRDG